MLYIRGQAADYDMWGQLGCTGWSWSDVLPYFRRAQIRSAVRTNGTVRAVRSTWRTRATGSRSARR
ncbi:GMC family oxidoreductase N-terminal domain-containing protein [Sphingomonas sp. MMS24-JH45]